MLLLESEGGEQQQQQQQSPPVAESSNAAMRFLLQRVVPWLSEEGRSHSEHLVDMIFSAMHCCSSQETTRILNHITTVTQRCRTTDVCPRVPRCFCIYIFLMPINNTTPYFSAQMDLPWGILLHVIQKVRDNFSTNPRRLDSDVFLYRSLNMRSDSIFLIRSLLC